MKKITLLFSLLLLSSCQGAPSPWLDSSWQQRADSIGRDVVERNGFASDLFIVIVDSSGHHIVESRTHSGDLGMTADFPDPHPGSLLFPMLLATVDSLDTTSYLPVGYHVFNSIPVVDDHALGHDSLPTLQALAQGSKVAAVEFCHRHYGHRREELRRRLSEWLPGQSLPKDLADECNFVRLCTGDFLVAPEALLEAYRKLMLSRPDIVGDTGMTSTYVHEGGSVTGLFVGHDGHGHTCLVVAEGCTTHTGSLMEDIASNIFKNH
ncbi:MAG: hypothetical protein J6X59_03885 [Bacteroidales bacterium]|nr:hypothetical protein [Bacteroidales bacterium]